MTIIGANTLRLNGNGWDIKTKSCFIHYSILYNLNTGIIDLCETIQDNMYGHTKCNYTAYASPAEFVGQYCLLCRYDIRDYTDISELNAGVESLLYCYLVCLQESLRKLNGDHDA